MPEFTFYYKLYAGDGDSESHKRTISAENQKDADAKWKEYCKGHSAIDVTNEKQKREPNIHSSRS